MDFVKLLKPLLLSINIPIVEIQEYGMAIDLSNNSFSSDYPSVCKFINSFIFEKCRHIDGLVIIWRKVIDRDNCLFLQVAATEKRTICLN